MLEKNLEKLGFYKNEAKVYLALLEMGFCTTGPLIKKTGLHRNIVYESLDKLITHGLVASTVQRGKKHFRPLSPDRILRQEKARLESAQELVGELVKLQKKEKQEIVVYEGKEGFQNAHLDLVGKQKPNSTIYIIMAGGKEWYENMGKVFKKYEKLRIEKKIKQKLLATETRREEIEKKQAQRKLFSARYLPASFKNPAGIVVWGETIAILVYGEPVLVITIKNKKVAQAHRQYFDILWRLAKY